MRIRDWSSDVCSSDLPDGGIQIDSFGHFFETIAHRVVGNGRQVDHRVSVSQQAWIDRSNIAEMLMIKILLWRGIFRRQAVAEEAGRSEERSEGNEGVIACVTGWARGTEKKKKDKKNKY